MDHHRARPRAPVGVGVLVLAGSSGRVDTARADRLAEAGADALALRWFGGAGQPHHPCEVPVETLVEGLDLLAPDVDRLAVVGLSYGAEAALLTAVRDPRLSGVVALAPTDVAWEGHRVHADDPARAKWTWGGSPVPFVPLDHTQPPTTSPPAFVETYRRSRQSAERAVVEAATIPAERFAGRLVLVAGGDDQVWPSSDMARAIVARRADAGAATDLVLDASAGHPVTLPGEAPSDPARAYRVGGDAGAPERLGRRAWPVVCDALGLRPGPPAAARPGRRAPRRGGPPAAGRPARRTTG